MNKLDWYFIRRKLSRPLWWFKHRFVPKHKYHVIYTKLGPGYSDCDLRILHGAFTPFKEFMDNIYEGGTFTIWDYSTTKPDEYISQEYIDERKAVWEEMEKLYCWWVLHDLMEQDLNNNFSLEAEVAFQNKEEEMLNRLMKIRRYLWD